MKIEIWSDVACPFCYIGKRHLEKAMEHLSFKDELEVVWKSYQLDPTYHNIDNESIYQHLANSKQMSVEQVKQMTAQVVEMAKNAGLNFNFEKNIPANTFNAHRLIHFAKQYNLQDAAKEALLKAYFIDGINVSDISQLVELGAEIGLKKEEVVAVLQSDKFTDEVKHDIQESKEIGVQGVPFFVLAGKYAISGAQPVSSFKDALKQSFEEWKVDQQGSMLKSLNKEAGTICDENGCEI